MGDLYASFMDTDTIEAKGLQPVQGLLDRARAVGDLTELAAFLGVFERIGGPGLFGSYITPDRGDASKNIVYLAQGGLGLPDESYYRDDKFAEIREKYVAYLTTLLTLSKHDDPAGAAARVLAYETRLAEGHWEAAETRDVQKTTNHKSLDELRELCPAFDWVTYVTGLGGTEETLRTTIVMQPDFFSHLSTVLEETPMETWRDVLHLRIIRSSAPYLPDEFVQANFDFYGRTLNGTPELRARWKRGVDFVEGAIGEAVGKVYVSRHFPPTSKAMMDELVANLVTAYRRSIETLDWMGEDTKQKAYDKLDRFYPKIGYPQEFRDYSALTISADDLMANVNAASAFETDRQLEKVGQPVDRDEWLMLPQTVNAYYHPGTNEICFPAAILQPPFFSPDAEEAENYGGIGAVIGHELGHGFDDQGAQYDGDGNLHDWWTAADKTAFEAKSQALVEAVRRVRAAHAAGRARQRQPHRRREHRRPRRPDHRPQGVRHQQGRQRLARRAPHPVPQLGARVAHQAPQGAGAAVPHHRPAQPGRVPRQHRAQPRRVPRGLRHAARRRPLARARGSRPDLVISGARRRT